MTKRIKKFTAPAGDTLELQVDSLLVNGGAVLTTDIPITNDTTTNATMYPVWVTGNTGLLPAKVTSSKLTYNPSSGELSTTTFTGNLSGNASTVTTNANLTGPVTSTGNATAIASGAIKANMLQNAAEDLGAADVTINLGNTNGSYVTNLTVDGTITATAGFNGSITSASQALGLTETSGPTQLTMAGVADNQYLKRSGNTIIGSVPAGAGDVVGPATNTDNYVPQWNGTDSKTLKNGYPVSSTPAATTVPLSDGSNHLDGWISSATTGTAGKITCAVASDVTTGTSATLAVTPDALAGSTIFGVKSCIIQLVADATDVDTTSGIAYFRIPQSCNGMNLIRAIADVTTAGTTNATTIQVRNMTKYSSNDALSSAISIASGDVLATAGTVNTSYDDVSTNDLIKVYVTGQSTTKPKGLRVNLEYQLP